MRFISTGLLALAILASGCIVRNSHHHGRSQGGVRNVPPGCKVNGAGKTVCPPGHTKRR
jgi:hypothetical protein